MLLDLPPRLANALATLIFAIGFLLILLAPLGAAKVSEARRGPRVARRPPLSHVRRLSRLDGRPFDWDLDAPEVGE